MQFTKYTGTLTGQVGSLITALDAILVTGEGWTKVFTGTNKAVYRAPSGNRLYLRVADDAGAAGGAKEAQITGYINMSDVDTGTGPFPTAAQGAGGVAQVIASKSFTADGTARSYRAWADARSLLFFSQIASDGNWFAFSFGEFKSFGLGDSYGSAICGRMAVNSPNTTDERLCMVQANLAAGDYFVARGYLGLGGSVAMGRHAEPIKMASTAFRGVIIYPNSTDGGLYLSRIWLHDPVTITPVTLRGRVRGLWTPLHIPSSFADGDIFQGTGELAGYTFEAVKTVFAAGTDGVAMIETSNTLETN